MYDDHFTTTKSLETNIIPSNWKTLFQERSANILQDDPYLRDSHELEPEWHADPIRSEGGSEGDGSLPQQPLSTAENTQTPLSDGTLSQLEPSLSPEVTSGLQTDTLVSNDHSRHGWNSAYNIRFQGA